VSNEQVQVEQEAPGGQPDLSTHNPEVDPGVIGKAAAAVAASQAAREGTTEAPEPAEETAQTGQQQTEVASEETATERPEMSATEYYAHLDDLQAQNRQLQQQLKQGGLGNLQQMSMAERMQAIGLDPTSPEALDAFLEAMGPADQPSAPTPEGMPALPEGTDPAIQQLISNQQQMMAQLQARLDQFEQGTQGLQQQLTATQQAAADQAELQQFGAVVQESPDKWATFGRAVQSGLAEPQLVLDVARSMTQRNGIAPTYGEVLDACEAHYQRYAALGAQQETPKQKPAEPAPEPVQESKTLGDAENATPEPRTLTEEEKVQRAVNRVKARQREREEKNKR
jgi:hypothetical protein